LSDFIDRLKRHLEPVLAAIDPRPAISAYHDMPYALFRYDPQDEFSLRRELTMLCTRLEQRGKRVLRISLAHCLVESMEAVQPLNDWYEAERRHGTDVVVDTIHATLAEHAPLVDLVAQRMPDDPDTFADDVLINRTGALFPAYRTFSLLEQLKGRVVVPTVLFYPGTLDGAAGLRFMGVLDAEHNYRPKIF
jgi:hypothetical protein